MRKLLTNFSPASSPSVRSSQKTTLESALLHKMKRIKDRHKEQNGYKASRLILLLEYVIPTAALLLLLRDQTTASDR